jgi:hypothetical protein
MSEYELLQLFDYIKTEAAKGGDWRKRVLNNTKYKILESQYDGLEKLLDKAEEQMQGASLIKYFIEKEIKGMIEERKRMNRGVKIPFFDEIDREVKRIKTRLTFHDIPNYNLNDDYLDPLITDLIQKEAEKDGLKFRG